MPQFELAPTDQPPVFVRARSPEDAVARHLDRQSGAAAVALADAQAGTGWQDVTIDGAVWGRIRPRDRMRFRRD